MVKLFNDRWEFSKQPLHTSLEEMTAKKEEFRPVGIPHDWLIYQDNLYEDATGWYRKTFTWKLKKDRQIFLRFDGIYMDSRIYVNGTKAGEWKYGYSTFEVDITDYLKDGANEILVSVTYQAPNSRWYTGAGIYRNVWLKDLPKTHIAADGIYFSAKQKRENIWSVKADIEIDFEDIEDDGQEYISSAYCIKNRMKKSNCFLLKNYCKIQVKKGRQYRLSLMF